jgi:uncharacterized membrane protein
MIIISHIQVLPFVLRRLSVQSTNQFLRLNLLVILTNKIITLVALLYNIIIMFSTESIVVLIYNLNGRSVRHFIAMLGLICNERIEHV